MISPNISSGISKNISSNLFESGPSPQSLWILSDGTWNDLKIWIDSETWID